MLVDSSGSRKPLARPSATQLRCHIRRRRPVVNFSRRGSASAPAIEIGGQCGGSLVVSQVRARVDVAIAGAMLQWNAPLPARGARRRACVRRRGAGLLAGYGHRAVAGQPVRPVVVAGGERLLDEQAAKTRAIDEQFAVDARAGLQGHRFDEAVRGAQAHVDDLALDALDATRLGVTSQVLRVQTGVEVIRIRDLRQRRALAARRVAPDMNLPSGAAAVFSEYSPRSWALPCRCSLSQYWWKGRPRYSWPMVPKPWI